MAEPDVILAGASVRSLAESAVRDGLRPFCVDMFGDADLRRLLSSSFGEDAPLFRQIDSFAETPDVLRTLPADIPIVLAGGLEHHNRVVRRLSRAHRLSGMSPEVTAQLRDPAVLFPALETAGVSVPAWRASAASPVAPDRRWLRKNARSSGGQGVTLVNSVDSVCGDEPAGQDAFYLQEFVPGVSASAVFLAASAAADPPSNHDKSSDARPVPSVRLLGVALQLSGASELNGPAFRFCGNVGPIRPHDQLRQKIEHMGAVIASGWPVSGIFGVDFVVREQDPFVLEVNPRVTASHELHEWANASQPGHVALQMASQAWREGVVSAPETRQRWARLVVYADQDVQISTVSQALMMQQAITPGRWPGAGPIWLADIPHDGAVIPVATPLCSVYLDLAFRERSVSEFARVLGGLPLKSPPAVEALVKRIQAEIAILEADLKLTR